MHRSEHSILWNALYLHFCFPFISDGVILWEGIVHVNAPFNCTRKLLLILVYKGLGCGHYGFILIKHTAKAFYPTIQCQEDFPSGIWRAPYICQQCLLKIPFHPSPLILGLPPPLWDSYYHTQNKSYPIMVPLFWDCWGPLLGPLLP